MTDKVIILGIAPEHTPATATRLKLELQEATGHRVIVITGTYQLQVITK